MRIAWLLAGFAGGCLALAGCRRDQVRFELEPAVASSCKQPVATRISWDVTPLGLTQVQVEVHNLGRQPKLWFVGAASGSEQAGAWAQDGYTVTLKAMNGVELARRTLTTAPCPGIDWL